MKYRKKPIIVEAFQWTGGPDRTEYPTWICEAINDGIITFDEYGMVIHTLESVTTAFRGDYVIKGANGELYPPCTSQIFEQTYERVE